MSKFSTAPSKTLSSGVVSNGMPAKLRAMSRKRSEYSSRYRYELQKVHGAYFYRVQSGGKSRVVVDIVGSTPRATASTRKAKGLRLFRKSTYKPGVIQLHFWHYHTKVSVGRCHQCRGSFCDTQSPQQTNPRTRTKFTWLSLG